MTVDFLLCTSAVLLIAAGLHEENSLLALVGIVCLLALAYFSNPNI